jgi:DNA-binding MarR family transcriptional regulator
VDPVRYGELAAVRRAVRAFLAASEVICRASGVTPVQYQAMLAIRTAPGERPTMKALADELVLTPHGAVQLVDRLARAGLATRERSEADRRRVFVVLTNEGRRLIRRLASEHIRGLLAHEAVISRSLRALKAHRRVSRA